ncbi:MAG TPA: ferrous iron transport protein B [Gemmatimonadetes bacterium]|nr:ferrous iron transport protein B [Gemmatimonadota bacterium]
MPTLTADPCVSCAQHRVQSLVRLGISTDRWDYLIALAGNPNVGKSTVFNELTGLRQHTGNWPGKTVVRAEGAFVHEGKRAKVVDLPGTYSLLAGSVDEEVARDFVLFGRPDVTVVVVDATRLERNLNLVLQILEITDRVVVFLNLVDEARRHGIAVDSSRLERELGVPVVQGVAREGAGIDDLVSAVHEVALGTHAVSAVRVEQHAAEVEAALEELAPVIQDAFPEVPNPRWVALRLLNADEAVEGAVLSGELGQLSHDESGAVVEIAPVEARQRVRKTAMSLRWGLPSDFQDVVTGRAYEVAEQIAARVQVRGLKKVGFAFDRKMDQWLTSRIFGFPLMLFILAAVFWITIEGANIPSSILATVLIDNGHGALKALAAGLGIPLWLDGLLLDGVYLATAWVVAVMLPPMAIFFPLFTLLEDFGYLPRVAFNLDALFRKAGAHGKQALTMCMGFGCNAAGVVATRVIDSPRERLVAIITNNFSLCNGRWPTQILIATIFIGALAPSQLGGLISAGAVVGIALLGIVMMFLSSWILTRTVLRGEATSFSLELPPYRPPRILRTLYTSIIDRTLIVLWRAVIFAIPAGAVIWLISNVDVSGVSLAHHAVGWLDPAGLLLGMNGVILLAYVVAIPANEIVIPTVLMLTVLTGGSAVGEGAGVMFELDSVNATGELLRAGGWTLLTGVNLMLFSLLHNPCSTTIYTIYKETRSTKWTVVATLMPLVMGLTVCFLVAQVWRLAAG